MSLMPIQSAKAYPPIEDSVDGRSMDVSDSHPLNADLPIFSTLPRLIRSTEMQSRNASDEIPNTPDGMAMDVSDSHLWNPMLPMLLTLSPSSTFSKDTHHPNMRGAISASTYNLTRPSHMWKAPSPIWSTVFGMLSSVILR